MTIQARIRSRIVFHGLLVAMLWIVASGCDSATAPSPDSRSPIQTSAQTYGVSIAEGWVTVEIPYSFTNITGSDVFLVNCLGEFDVQLERREDAAWRPVWSPALSTCVSEPIVVPAGAIFHDTLSVVGALPGTAGFPDFESVQPTGTYHLVWPDALSSYQPQAPFGDPIALEFRTSNSFELELR